MRNVQPWLQSQAASAHLRRGVGWLLASGALGVSVALSPTYVPIIVGATLGGIGIILRPTLGWYTLALLAAPIAVVSAEIPSTALGLSGIAALTSVASLRQMRPGTARPSRVGFLFVGYFAFSVGWALALWPSSDAARTFALSSALIGGALLTGLETIAPVEIVRRLGACFAASTVVTALVSMGISLAADRAIGSTIAQADAANRNVLGLLYVLGVITIVTRHSPAGRVIPRLLAAGGTLILVIAIIDTFSRSSYLAFAAVSVLLAVSRGRKMFILVSGACAVVLGVLPDVVLSHLGSGLGLGSQGLDLSSATRIDLWAAAIKMILAYPLIGVGFGGFGAALPSFWSGDASGFAAVTSISGYAYAHNLPLTILASGGVVGLILAAGFASRFVRPSGWRRTFADRANLVLVSVAVASLFGEPLLTSPCLIACLLLVKRAPHDLTVAGPQPLGSP